MATDPNPVPLSSHRHNTVDKDSATTVTQPIHMPSQIHITPRALSSDLANILPSNQAAVSGTSWVPNPIRTSCASATFPETNIAMEMGSGPLRLPKPLTTVDLYAQLEKEQEAVVNRLTRELSLLRSAQNTSVASSLSSTASGFPESFEYNVNGLLSRQSHPVPSYSRRHRSSSATSSRSMAAFNPASCISSVTTDRYVGRTGLTMQDSGSGINQLSSGNNELSRQNSLNKNNLQGQDKIEPSSSITVPKSLSNNQHYHVEQPHSVNSSSSSRLVPLRDEASRSQSMINLGGEKDIQLTSRFKELTLYRSELEIVKKENDALRHRVRELEALLTQKKKLVREGCPSLSGNENTQTSTGHREEKVENKGDNVHLTGPYFTRTNLAG